MFELQQSKLHPVVALAAFSAAFLPWGLKPLCLLVFALHVTRNRNIYQITRHAFSPVATRLVLFHALILSISAYVNNTPASDWALTASMAVAFPIFAAAGSSSPRERQAITRSLELAAIAFCAVQAIYIDWGQFLSPTYRGDKDSDVFVALNGAALFCMQLERLRFADRLPHRCFHAFAAAMFLLFPLVIKSRGSLAACFIAFCWLFLRQRNIGVMAILLVPLASGLALVYASSTGQLESVLSFVSSFLSLDEEGARSVAEGSGRFRAWEYAIATLWPESPWIGHGPRANYGLLFEATRVSGGHNVLVASLVDGGMVACATMLTLLALPLAFIRRWTTMYGHSILPVIYAAALNENLLLSYGSPFSWITLILLAACPGIDATPHQATSTSAHSQARQSGNHLHH